MQAVQAGGDTGGGGGSTVISWVVDDDNSVVKYCQDNIVTIFVPGDTDTSDDSTDDSATALAIVANSTLRLRIVPCDPDHLGCVQISSIMVACNICILTSMATSPSDITTGEIFIFYHCRIKYISNNCFIKY